MMTFQSKTAAAVAAAKGRNFNFSVSKIEKMSQKANKKTKLVKSKTCLLDERRKNNLFQVTQFCNLTRANENEL